MHVHQSAHPKATDLNVSTEGSMVQSSASCPVGHVHVAEQRDQSLGAAHRFVASGDVERRLPVLVSRINICTVLQQHCYCILERDPVREVFLPANLFSMQAL